LIQPFVAGATKSSSFRAFSFASWPRKNTKRRKNTGIFESRDGHSFD
jgi:hypothetical protein